MEIQVIEPRRREAEKLRVCAYCRVSTEEEEQANSLENQIGHYEKTIRENPRYEFAGVYKDYGISGFKEVRPGFQKLLTDARSHKFELIITKSVSRFCRNTDTLLKAVRELKDLGIGIYFELQNINTLTMQGELLLTVIAAFAQAESENYRELSKMVYRRKYMAGEPVQYLERSFGFKKLDSGKVTIDREEAAWVKKIFELYAEGYNLKQVADFLNDAGVKTTNGASFIECTVVRILENVIYKGDYIMHRYFVDENRKEQLNRGQEDAWYCKNDHEPIVGKKLWDAVQERLRERRQYLSEGSVIGELSEENYPYMNKVFCAECGYPLYRRVYSNGNRVCWLCSGKRRFNKEFCTGINVPDSVLRNWGNLPGNIYIRKAKDTLGKAEFRYVKESSWKVRNKKKAVAPSRVPELNADNYPYYGRLYCARCGSRLTRKVNANNTVTWICDGYKRKGKEFCEGVSIPDKEIRSFGDLTGDIYISGKEKNGKRSYSYSGSPEKTGKAGKGKQSQ